MAIKLCAVFGKPDALLVEPNATLVKPNATFVKPYALLSALGATPRGLFAASCSTNTLDFKPWAASLEPDAPAFASRCSGTGQAVLLSLKQMVSILEEG